MSAFTGKVVVITGAGSGIGRESAFGFAAEGGRIVCSDIDQATAEGTAEEIRTRGGEAFPTHRCRGRGPGGDS